MSSTGGGEDNDGIRAGDYSAAVDLQELLNHTTKRIMECVGLKSREETLIMISKVGYDGCTGQSIYKQLVSKDVELASIAVEESLFLTCLVPLQIYNKETGEVVWTNTRPSSTLYCRPIRFQYIKESKDVVMEESNFFKEFQSVPTLVDGFTIYHELEETMVDGKVATILSDVTNATTSCSICGLTSSTLNDIEKVERVAAELPDDSFRHGLSTLHLWIRSMECFLHISYRLGFKKWQARGSDKILKQEKQKKVQKEMRTALGINVDVPKSGGAGNSNDGNTARRFFKGYKKAAEVLGMNEELMFRFYVTLCILSSNEDIDPDKLKDYNKETARMYISMYNWYNIPQAVHKMLAHGHQVVRIKALPVGSLSEEPQESSNKVFKHSREHHTSKFSRVHTNYDLMSRMLCSSDPKVSSMRRSQAKDKLTSQMPEEAKKLLMG